ncbi:MAG: hypothetical protein HS126_16580 [Anaerolineales bacterium]|nr:hypothetical protein [Anaerolineales bacterium]
MITEKFLLMLGIFSFGFFAIYLGIMVRMGKWRHLFLGGSFPVLAPVGSFLIAIPTGLGFITIGVMIIFPEYKDPLTIPLLFLGFVAVILGLWTPNWLLPDWLHWLMENYEHVLSGMFEEVRQMGIKRWEEETQTQTGLENWAKRVAKKHGWMSKKELEKAQSYPIRKTYPQDIDPAAQWRLQEEAYEKSRNKKRVEK